MLIPSSCAGTANLIRLAMRTDDNRRTVMLEQARESAARRHYPMMVEAVLRANEFQEAAEWIDQLISTKN
jgi:hypothetical protein